MRVLIATADLYSKTGGGESYYSALIERNSSIDFCFFQWSTDADYGWSDETSKTALPLNTSRIPLRSYYRDRCEDFRLHGFTLPLADRPIDREAERIALTLDMAASVSGQSFEVVEIPDYLVHGWILPFALRYFGVRVGKIVLGMHGTISDALFQNWGNPDSAETSLLERSEALLYRISDIRYGMGERYLRAWAETEGLPAQLIGHHHIFDYGKFSRGSKYAIETGGKVPDLAFIGRQDRWKGPDLFLELCAQLPRASYRHIHLYGPATEVAGISSVTALTAIANNRGLKFQSNRVMPWPMLQEALSQRPMVTILPSRRDTFNLAALESLLHGCPTVISSRAGAVDFLDAAFPGIPYIKLPVQNIAAAVPQIRELCAHYPEHRAMLREYWNGREPLPYGRPLDEIYAEATTADPGAVYLAEQLAGSLIRHVHANVLPLAERSARSEFAATLAGTREWSKYQMGAEPFETAFDAGQTLSRMTAELGISADTTATEAPLPYSDRVVGHLCEILGGADRSRISRLLAFLERQRGNDLLFATYLIRYFRLTGRSPAAEVDLVTSVLERSNLAEEAKVFRLMVVEGEKATYDYLQGLPAPAELDQKTGILDAAEFGNPVAPKVSVIVSVYNGALKIPHFIRRLYLLSEATRRMIEIIFVDSDSTDDTRDVLFTCLREKGLEAPLFARYLRTERRETIQHAWNRGITAARAPYLGFLGIDEAFQPDAIPLLAEILDRRSDVDWVQGSALVTEVDEAGTFVRDVFLHRRSTESQNIHYLECTHIAYVGAIYRRDLHARFGLYDPRFRTAGDNEFKNRVLPFIRVLTVPDVLGTFLNYPERRTTESPVAELEDLRAWYVHRTPAGIRYAFDHQSDHACIDQFFRSLKYRRSFLTDNSTDVEYALAFADYMARYRPEAYREIELSVPSVSTLLNGYRGLDELVVPAMPPSLVELERRSQRIRDSLWEIAQASLTHANHGFHNAYWYRNDNRSQQHYFPWPSWQRHFSLGAPLDWGDLAGARDLAELVDLCVEKEAGDHKSNRAGLSDEAVLNILILADESAGVSELLDALVRLWERLTVLIIGISPNEELRWQAPKGVYFAEAARDLRPLLAAAQLVVIPASDGDNQQSLWRHLVLSAGYGRALLVHRSVEVALGRHGLSVNLAALPCFEAAEDLWAQAQDFLNDPEARKQLGAAADSIRTSLRQAGIVQGGLTSSDLAVVEWGPEIVSINEMLFRCFAGGAGASEAANILSEQLSSGGPEAQRIEAVLRALFVDKTAAALSSSGAVFRAIRRLQPMRSAANALGLLHTGSRELGGFLALLLASFVRTVTMERQRTPLQEWRSAQPRLRIDSTGPSSARVAVLLHTDAADSSSLKSLASELVASLSKFTSSEYWTNLELWPQNGRPSGPQKPTSRAATLVALAQADLIICLGTPSSRFRADSIELAVMALRSGRPVLGNGHLFWHLEGEEPGFVFENGQRLASEATRLLTDPSAAQGNLIDVSRTLLASPSTAFLRELEQALRTVDLWHQFEAAEYQAVVEGARELLAEAPNGELHYLLALALHHLDRDPLTALAHYDRALQAGVSACWVCAHRGRLRQATGDLKGAEADYETVIDKVSGVLDENRNADLHYLMAFALHQLGRAPEQAVAHYDQALELGFDEHRVRLHRGRLRQLLGYGASGAADLTQAATLNPSRRQRPTTAPDESISGNWPRIQARCLEGPLPIEPRRALWGRRVKSKPLTTPELIAMADRARDARDWRSAAICYQAALDLDPSRAPIWVQLGHALKEYGDRPAAEEAYRRALAIDSGDADTYLQLGHVLKLQSRRREAAGAYLEALLHDAALETAHAELQGLGYRSGEIRQALARGYLADTQTRDLAYEPRSGPWGKPQQPTSKLWGAVDFAVATRAERLRRSATML